jgi:hypothetical protein
MKELHLSAPPATSAEVDPSSLSPKRLKAGATAKAELVNESFRRNLRFIYLRHWLNKDSSALPLRSATGHFQ